MCKKKEYTSMFKSLSLKSKKVGYNTLTHRSYLIQDGIAFNNDGHVLHVLSHINPCVYHNFISLHTFSSFFLLYLSFFKFFSFSIIAFKPFFQSAKRTYLLLPLIFSTLIISAFVTNLCFFKNVFIWMSNCCFIKRNPIRF